MGQFQLPRLHYLSYNKPPKPLTHFAVVKFVFTIDYWPLTRFRVVVNRTKKSKTQVR